MDKSYTIAQPNPQSGVSLGPLNHNNAMEVEESNNTKTTFLKQLAATH